MSAIDDLQNEHAYLNDMYTDLMTQVRYHQMAALHVEESHDIFAEQRAMNAQIEATAIQERMNEIEWELSQMDDKE